MKDLSQLFQSTLYTNLTCSISLRAFTVNLLEALINLFAKSRLSGRSWRSVKLLVSLIIN